jgi:preprotein translocase subunit SecY
VKNFSKKSLTATSPWSALKNKIIFTLLALVIFRVGSYIPLPGIDAVVLEQVVHSNAGGILGVFNLFSGGSLGRMSIFSLAIMPYITASIVMQLATMIFKDLENIKKEGGEQGRQKITQWTRYLTVFLSVFQAYGVCAGLFNLTPSDGRLLVIIPSTLFYTTSIISLCSGTLFLMWLGEQISSRGIGNGTSLIIFSGIVAGLPEALVTAFEMARSGAIATFTLLILLFAIVFLVVLIVLFERAQRRIVVQYPKRQLGGNRMIGNDTSHIPLKLNNAGVIPPIFASSILLFPVTIASFANTSGNNSDSDLWQFFSLYLAHGKPLYIVIYAFLIIFFTFFYTSVVFNPSETAEMLKKHGGFVPGKRPGVNTAEFFHYVLLRLTVLGAAYISFVCILPEIFISKLNIPFYLGGTSVLIVVNVIMDTFTQIQTHLYAARYERQIKKFNFSAKK